MYEEGIETTIGTYALHLQPYFARRYNYLPGDIANSGQAYNRSLTLPLYAGLNINDIDFIAQTLNLILEDILN